MTVLTYIVTLACCIVVGLLLVALICALVSEIIEKIGKLRYASRNDTYALAKRETGQLIYDYSHWFSESHDAMTALSAVGDYIAKHAYFDVESARDDWRTRRRSNTDPELLTTERLG